jgi:predicted lipid-binding transport protein (Tim44 family)
MRRLSRFLATCVALAVFAAPAAVFAAAPSVPAPQQGAAGGGSGGFGGGGGGGGGGGFGGGGGGGGFGGGGGGGCCIVWSNDPGVALVAFLLIVGFFVAIMIMGWLAKKAQLKASTWSREHAAWRDKETAGKRRRRAKEVPPAARKASEDDQHFAMPEAMAAAETLFHRIQEAWDDRDVPALRAMVNPDLMIEWERRLADFADKGWHNRVAVDTLKMEYVGLVNRDDDDDDRIVMRVSSEMDDYVIDRWGRTIAHSGNPSPQSWLREYWTLGIRNGKWMLLSIEQDTEGEHHLTDPIVPLPDEDVGSIRDEVVIDRGVEARAPEGTRLGELIDVDFADDALLTAKDLALVDGRMDPDVIEVAVRRTISAWAEAVDGEDDALLEVAPASVVEDLLRPEGPKTRLVIRGATMKKATVTHLRAEDPIQVAIDSEVTGVRYVEDRDTVVVVSGDKDRQVTFLERFVLQLDDDPDNPWKLVGAGELERR